MPFKPADVRKQVFKKVLRGFDPEEVDAFLSMIAEEWESLLQERTRAFEEIAKLRNQVRELQVMKQTPRTDEAATQAEKITESARNELQKLRQEIRFLRTQKESFTNRLRHLLKSEIELIDVLNLDEIAPVDGEEERGRFLPRGRLPRPVIADVPSSAGTEAAQEPVIVRSEASFAEPYLTKPAETDPEPEEEAQEQLRIKPGGRISDQLII